MSDAPAPFLLEWLPKVRGELGEGARALDIAMGLGRHAVVLAAHGFRVFGLDRDLARVAAAREAARGRGFELRAWVADLTQFPLPTRDSISRSARIICSAISGRPCTPP